MKKILLAAFLAVSLGGCASLTQDIAKLQYVYQVATTATVPAPTAQIAVSSFQVVEAASTEYFVYCKSTPAASACAPGTVDNPGPLRLVIKYVRAGRDARDQIKAAGKSGGLIATTVYNTLVQAITNLSASPVASFGGTK